MSPQEILTRTGRDTLKGAVEEIIFQEERPDGELRAAPTENKRAVVIGIDEVEALFTAHETRDFVLALDSWSYQAWEHPPGRSKNRTVNIMIHMLNCADIVDEQYAAPTSEMDEQYKQLLCNATNEEIATYYE